MKTTLVFLSHYYHFTISGFYKCCGKPLLNFNSFKTRNINFHLLFTLQLQYFLRCSVVMLVCWKCSNLMKKYYMLADVIIMVWSGCVQYYNYACKLIIYNRRKNKTQLKICTTLTTLNELWIKNSNSSVKKLETRYYVFTFDICYLEKMN